MRAGALQLTVESVELIELDPAWFEYDGPVSA